MTTDARLSLAHLLDTSVVLTAHDAVAIIVQLAHSPQMGRPRPVPLDPSHVWLEPDGSVTLSPGLLPPLGDVAALLDRLLGTCCTAPDRRPIGLDAIVQRASGHVVGASIPSLTAFAAALAPFQPPDPAAAVRLLVAAVEDAAAPPALPPPVPAEPSTPPAIVEKDAPWRPTRTHLVLAIGATIVAAAVGAGSARLRDAAPSLPVAAAAAPPIVEASPTIDPPAPAPDTHTQPVSAATPKIDAPAPPVEVRPARLVDRRAVEARAVFSPSFAPTGSAVFFHAESAHGSALKRADADERGELRVATIVDDGARNYHVQLSPDGTHVAFDSDRDGERGVYVATAAGRDVRRVSGAGYAAVPSWSPDGTRLAFIRAEADRPAVWNLWLLDRDSGQQTRVTGFRRGQVWGGAWFADGARIAYSHEDRLTIHDLASGRSREIASPLAGRLIRTPAVSPEGRWIVFQVFRDGVWLFDVDRGTMRRVLDDASAEEFAWSPDGRRVAYHSRRSGGWNLWTMAAP